MRSGSRLCREAMARPSGSWPRGPLHLRSLAAPPAAQAAVIPRMHYNASPCAVQVDVIISTIGFPLVGGPAGTMEGGRQAEVAREILSSKNVPYMVAAPLLIQDLRSWTENGVAGLQSVVRPLSHCAASTARASRDSHASRVLTRGCSRPLWTLPDLLCRRCGYELVSPR